MVFTLKEYLTEKAIQDWDVFQSMYGREYFSKHYINVRLRGNGGWKQTRVDRILF